MSIVIATAGPVTLTGIVAETSMVSLRIPGGTIGRNGLVELRTLWSMTNSANNKTMWTRYSATPGSTTAGQFNAQNVFTTVATAQGLSMLGGNNSTSSQVEYYTNASGFTGPYGASGANIGTFSLDTTADTYVCINGQIAAAGETLTLQHAALVVFPSP